MTENLQSVAATL